MIRSYKYNTIQEFHEARQGGSKLILLLVVLPIVLVLLIRALEWVVKSQAHPKASPTATIAIKPGPPGSVLHFDTEVGWTWTELKPPPVCRGGRICI